MSPSISALFPTATEAQTAVQQLLAAGFAREQIEVATRETLRAAHVSPPDAAGSEPVEESIVRFFSDLITGNETPEEPGTAAPAGPDSAVVAVRITSDQQADRAREILDKTGAIDVYRQDANPSSARSVNDVDISGNISLLRDDNNLDANGLTTH